MDPWLYQFSRIPYLRCHRGFASRRVSYHSVHVSAARVLVNVDFVNGVVFEEIGEVVS